jgi:hypothetical protein
VSRLPIALVLLIALPACDKKKRDDDCRESASYAPTAMEVPLPDDFTRAADKRVGADNYRKELSRIERELAELADADALSAERGASAVHP